MKHAILLVVFAACSGGQHPSGTVGNTGSGSGEPAGFKDTRTPLEKRRDTACEQVAPRVTACAVEDAKKDLAAGKVTKAQFDQDTASGVQKKNTDEFVKKCQASSMSSRQVRVLEVCPKAEAECEPLLSCLENLNKS
jgi:hypothetical protein